MKHGRALAEPVATATVTPLQLHFVVERINALVKDAAMAYIEAGEIRERMRLLPVLMGLQRVKGVPGCWCEHGIGNPMVPEHSESCATAQRFVQMCYAGPEPPPADHSAAAKTHRGKV